MSESNFETYIPEVREGFYWEQIPDGCLLYEERSGKLITLNSAAEAVLTYCDGELTVGEIFRALESDFQITREEAESVLKKLLDEGVI